VSCDTISIWDRKNGFSLALCHLPKRPHLRWSFGVKLLGLGIYYRGLRLKPLFWAKIFQPDTYWANKQSQPKLTKKKEKKKSGAKNIVNAQRQTVDRASHLGPGPQYFLL